MTAARADILFWDRIARKYARDPIKDAAGYERTLERTASLLKERDRVLELGCGTGTTALRLAPHAGRIVATDVSAEMIAIAREKAAQAGSGNVTFVVAAAEDTSWPDSSFDVVLAFNVLHLLGRREAALQTVRRILKPGGLFISKTPCLGEMSVMIRMAMPVMRAIGKAPHVDVFSGDELAREIAAAGLTVEDCARHGSARKDPRIFIVARRAAD